jgi:hypothetical protein
MVFVKHLKTSLYNGLSHAFRHSFGKALGHIVGFTGPGLGVLEKGFGTFILSLALFMSIFGLAPIINEITAIPFLGMWYATKYSEILKKESVINKLIGYFPAYLIYNTWYIKPAVNVNNQRFNLFMSINKASSIVASVAFATSISSFIDYSRNLSLNRFIDTLIFLFSKEFAAGRKIVNSSLLFLGIGIKASQAQNKEQETVNIAFNAIGAFASVIISDYIISKSEKIIEFTKRISLSLNKRLNAETIKPGEQSKELDYSVTERSELTATTNFRESIEKQTPYSNLGK